MYKLSTSKGTNLEDCYAANELVYKVVLSWIEFISMYECDISFYPEIERLG